MKRTIIPCLLLLVGAISCNNNNGNEVVRMKAIILGQESTFGFVDRINEGLYQELEDKLRDPHTAFSAQVWQPKALAVKNLSDSLVAYINELGTTLKNEAGLTVIESKGSSPNAVSVIFFEKGNACLLYDKLAAYQQNINGVLKPEEFHDRPFVQSDVKHFLEQVKKASPLNILQAQNEREAWVSVYFKNVTALTALALLNKIQNDIVTTENMFLWYCNINSVSNFCGYARFEPLVSLSSNSIKQGDSIQITARISAYNGAVTPRLTINKTTIETSAGFIGNYTLKSSGKPGKYAVPIDIEFVQPDGSRATISKNVYYTVLP
jgi:hypothetical protein